MRDHDQRACTAQACQGFGDDRLVLGVQCCRGFVHQQDRRALDQRTGDRDTLTLATGQACPALTHRGRQAHRQALDNLLHASLPRGLQYLCVAGVGFAEANVVGDAALEQVRVLEDLADLRVELLTGHLSHVHACDAHLALADLEKPCDQPQQRGLARTGSPHQRGHAAGLNTQAHPAQHVPRTGRVAKAHIEQFHRGIPWRLRRARRLQGRRGQYLAHRLKLHPRRRATFRHSRPPPATGR